MFHMRESYTRFLKTSLAWSGVYLLGYFGFSVLWITVFVVVSILIRWREERDIRQGIALNALQKSSTERGLLAELLRIDTGLQGPGKKL